MANALSSAVKKYPVRTTITLTLVAIVYVLLFVLPLVEISQKLMPLPAALISLLAAAPILGRMSFEYWPNEKSRFISRIVMTWAGICFLYGCIRLLTNLIGAVIGLEEHSLWDLKAALAVGFVLTLYSIANALNLRVKELRFTSKKLTRSYNLVQISDVHLGSRSPKFLPRILSKVKPLSPDLLLITGDFIDMNGITEEDLTSFQNLDCPVYFIIGNHERYIDLDDVLKTLANSGINILRNRSEQWQELEIIGIDDAERKDKVKRELPGIERQKDLYQILMYHRPDGFSFAAEEQIDLMLCGHTHNGQIIPFNFLVKRVFKRIHGLYTVAGKHLYVSPGTGTWGPVMRLGSKNEITQIILSPQAS